MPTQRLEKPREREELEVAPLNPLTIFPSPGSNAMFRAGSAWFDGMTSINQEILTFYQAELHRGIELSQALCRCSSFDEVIGATRSTLDCYYQEAGKLLDLFAEAGRRTLGRIKSGGAGDRGASQPH